MDTEVDTEVDTKVDTEVVTEEDTEEAMQTDSEEVSEVDGEVGGEVEAEEADTIRTIKVRHHFHRHITKMDNNRIQRNKIRNGRAKGNGKHRQGRERP